ncbi:hypothetical protein ANN_15146 [Periplaneta americana]|uniref:Mutator-like transposase domain-containing protein n=1 Tax=Periplaneta americana TaxID=6978 RepID=A0ABQ8SZP0_PERAM|nr:hypothetical protein ANN_15146 [Periplaneta americana]
MHAVHGQMSLSYYGVQEEARRPTLKAAEKEMASVQDGDSDLLIGDASEIENSDINIVTLQWVMVVTWMMTKILLQATRMTEISITVYNGWCDVSANSREKAESDALAGLKVIEIGPATSKWRNLTDTMSYGMSTSTTVKPTERIRVDGMEVAIAEVLWKRSVNVCGMRCVTMFSDGDSKAFNHLQSLTVYGNEVKLQKDECINHVSKRLVTGLSEWRAKRVPGGGTKTGRLTKETILKLQLYYRQAIKNNIPNVQYMPLCTMQCLQMKSLNTSSGAPGGASSWCFYNRATARGEIPPKHDKTTMTTVWIRQW